MWLTVEGAMQAVADAHEKLVDAINDREYHNHEMMRAHLRVIDAERDVRKAEAELMVARGEPS